MRERLSSHPTVMATLDFEIPPGPSGDDEGSSRGDTTTAARREASAEAGPIVFVVDDDPMMASLIGATIESAGYRVRVFVDGMDAVTAAQTLPPDILLVDLTMPQLSGAETMVRIRKLRPALPVLVISGLSKEEARETAPGANAFIEKPFNFGALLRAIVGLRQSQ